MTHVHLLRRLGFKESFAIVVGSMIGTGVFLKTAVMAQEAGSPFYVLLAWLVAGLLSFMGALVYAELGCLFPAALDPAEPYPVRGRPPRSACID